MNPRNVAAEVVPPRKFRAAYGARKSLARHVHRPDVAGEVVRRPKRCVAPAMPA